MMRMKCLLWFLHRCQGYIKARMKSEEKRRTRFHSGHGTSLDLCVQYCDDDDEFGMSSAHFSTSTS